MYKRICWNWKQGIQLEIKSAADALIIICRNFSVQKFLKAAKDIFFIVLWMVALWLKLQMEMILKWSYLYSSSIFTYLHLDFKNCNVSICWDTSWTIPVSKVPFHVFHKLKNKIQNFIARFCFYLSMKNEIQMFKFYFEFLILSFVFHFHEGIEKQT